LFLSSVRHRPHELAVSLSHQAPALLDEEYPIVIDITNVDERHLDVIVDVLLQPTEVDQAGLIIRFLTDLQYLCPFFKSSAHHL
jgi:hypothetical protein